MKEWGSVPDYWHSPLSPSLPTDVMLEITMLTWISLVHPHKISGLEAWWCNDYLWLWIVQCLPLIVACFCSWQSGYEKESSIGKIGFSFFILDLLVRFILSMSAVSRFAPLTKSNWTLHEGTVQMCLASINKSTHVGSSLEVNYVQNIVVVKTCFCSWWFH